ncbi:MAG: hypothetical protein O3B24_01455 [Verrucomicrobia bacterium]|nr:hypothetical protein [Verrucomicrobiota bacterium]
MAISRRKKIALSVLGIVVALLVATLVVVIFYLGAVVKTAVETAGPKFTGGPVKLASAHIYPLRGKLSLEGFVVGNPPGYDSSDAIRLGSIKVDMAPMSVTKDTIIIHSVIIDGPEITLEGNPFGDNNLTQIQKNAEGAGPAKAPPAPKKAKPKAAPAEPEKPAKKVIIEDLVIRNGKLHFGNAISIPLPEIHMRDIGKDKDMTLADTASLLIKALKDSAAQTAKGIFKLGGKGLKLAGDTAGDAIGAAGQVAGDTVGAVGNVAGDVAGGVGKAAGNTVGAAAEGVKKLGSGLGGLLKGGNKKEQPEESNE